MVLTVAGVAPVLGATLPSLVSGPLLLSYGRCLVSCLVVFEFWVTPCFSSCVNDQVTLSVVLKPSISPTWILPCLYLWCPGSFRCSAQSTFALTVKSPGILTPLAEAVCCRYGSCWAETRLIGWHLGYILSTIKYPPPSSRPGRAEMHHSWSVFAPCSAICLLSFGTTGRMAKWATQSYKTANARRREAEGRNLTIESITGPPYAWATPTVLLLVQFSFIDLNR